MPPKKAKSRQAKATNGSTRSSKKQPSKQEATTEARSEQKRDVKTAVDDAAADASSSAVHSKRKRETTPKSVPNKAPRRSGRGAPKPAVDQTRMLQYLISPAAIDLCRPKDEIEDIAKRGSNLKTYSDLDLTPFEELVCAVVLSRPISHRLGVRTIRTIFNEPYNFSTPRAIRDAGEEKRHQALWDARTQHKDKTARELGGLADVVVERLADSEDDPSLEKVRTEAKYDVNKV